MGKQKFNHVQANGLSKVQNLSDKDSVIAALGWGMDSSGNPSNKSFWPSYLDSAQVTSSSGTTKVFQYAQSSPLYLTDAGYGFGNPLAFTGGTNNYDYLGYRLTYSFPSVSVAKDITTQKEISISRQAATIVSVLWGSLRKLSAGTDYAEELRKGAGTGKTPSDFTGMTAVSGPYTDLHGSGSNTYNLSGASGTTQQFMHKITFSAFPQEDSFRLAMMGTESGGSVESITLYIWDYLASDWVQIGAAHSGSELATAGVIDLPFSSTRWFSGGIMYLLCRARGNGTTVTYRAMDMWVGWKNPRDV